MILNHVYNTGYEVIFVAFTGIIAAQIIKFFFHLIVKRQVDLRLFTTTGGMPSSHAAGVMGLSTSVGQITGFDSIPFAIAIGYAFIVMYDAAGVRRAAGKQARIINKILDTPGLSTEQVQEKLVEALGHTPVQVFAGAVIGILIGLLV